MSRVVIAVVAFLATLSAAAQSQPQPRTWNFWLKTNAQSYRNFYQAPEGSPEEDVRALQGELGANYVVSPKVTAYGAVNFLHFDDAALEDSPGLRLGVRGDARPHAFDVYVESLDNRPSFELDQFAGANIRRLNGNYAYRFAENWQVSADLESEKQDLDNNLRDNEFRSVGFAVRWRGSRLFSPEIGFRGGERDVNDDAESYDQRESYLAIRSQPVRQLYLSVRFRNRQRDYQNIAREDERRQVTIGADYTVNPHLVLNFYAAGEDAESDRPGRDFDSSYAILGFTWKF